MPLNKETNQKTKQNKNQIDALIATPALKRLESNLLSMACETSQLIIVLLKGLTDAFNKLNRRKCKSS